MGSEMCIRDRACNAYSNLSLAETPHLFLEFHSTEAGLESQTEMVKDIATANGGSDFQWATLQVMVKKSIE